MQVVLAGEIGGRFSEEAHTFLQGSIHPRTFAFSGSAVSEMHRGVSCWHVLRPARSHRPFSIVEACLGVDGDG